MREISAGIIIYRRTGEGPKFLLLYHGGRYWNFPKGKIGMRTALANPPATTRHERAGRHMRISVNKPTRMVKESSFQAALREVREETGLSDRDLKLNERFKVYDQFVYTRNKKKIFKTVFYYLAETTERDIKISKEHAGYGWFLYRDAPRMLMYQNLKNNLKRVYEIVQRKSLQRRKKGTKR